MRGRGEVRTAKAPARPGQAGGRRVGREGEGGEGGRKEREHARARERESKREKASERERARESERERASERSENSERQCVVTKILSLALSPSLPPTTTTLELCARGSCHGNHRLCKKLLFTEQIIIYRGNCYLQATGETEHGVQIHG